MSADDLAYVTTPGAALEERRRRFAGYWRHVRLTGFSQCLLQGWRTTFGIDKLTGDMVEPLSAAIGETGSVKAYVGLLRNKIAPDPRYPRFIRARSGLGYYLEPRSPTSGGKPPTPLPGEEPQRAA